jgi:hypothetical protein
MEPRRRPELSLGDVVRVLRTLRLPPEALPDVAAMLGVATARSPVAKAAGEVPAAPTQPARAISTAVAPPRQRRSPGPAPAPTPVPEREEEGTRPAELIVHPTPSSALAPPRRFRPLEELVGPPPEAAPPPEDLLAAALQRAILGALASSERNDGELDVEALVERIAAGESVARLPQRPVLTTRLGVRLLADVGGGMVPFSRDVERLAAQVERIAGADGFERLDFDGTPLGDYGVGRGPMWDWRPYAEQDPLLPGRPVLALTDIGIGGHRARRGETARSWLEFAAGVATAGGRLVLLVPYPRARWPAALQRSIAIAHWDRGMLVRDALDAVR